MIQAVPTVLALTATVLAGLLLVRKAMAWGFIDIPDPRKVHVLPTPRTGGLAMVLGGSVVFALSVVMGWSPLPTLPWQTWVAGLGFITVGALDDRYSFHPRQKVLVLLCISALAAWPWVMIFKSTGTQWLPSSMVGSPVFFIGTVVLVTLWFMAVPNAVNIEDAINGYMGGFTFILLLGLFFRGVDTRIPLGALLGFLCLNWPKAKHFMGDAGSYGCGFFIAEAILRGGGWSQPFLALIFTAPISIDVAMGLIRRKRLGVSFFTADRATCPHHMLELMNGNPATTTPILWLSAAAFVWFSRWPWVALGQAIIYAGVLTFLNRRELFHPRLKGNNN